MHLSVLIPTLNRASLTASLLDSLAQLDPVPWEWEVIVVDNGSTDNTAELVKQKKAELPIRIRYVLEERPGLHQGRHRGAIEAKGQHLAYLDDDMLLASSWLHGVDMLDEGKADIVVGRVIPLWESRLPEWLSRMCSSGVFGLLGLLDLGETPIETEHFFGGNLFIPRQSVFDFGGFHPDGMPQNLLQYRGDGETGLWLKMKAAGKSLWYSPSTVAYHIVPKSRMTLEYLKKRSYNQGISQSFTDLRVWHGLYENQTIGVRLFFREARKRVYRLPAVIFAQYLLRQWRATSDVERKLALVYKEIANDFSQGWLFHRAALRKNNEFRAYILRSTFIE